MPQSRLLHRLGLVVPLAVAGLVMALALRAERARVHDWGFPLDAAWVHAAIARNLADGHGWTVTAGEASQASAGPLWTLLVAAGFAVFGAGALVPQTLGAACVLGCVVFAWRLGRRASGSGAAGVTAAFATATCAPLLWLGLSGMETALAALLFTACVDVFAAWRSGRRRFAWAVLAALATWARPEAFVLFPVLALVRWRERSAAHGSGRDIAIAVGMGFLLLVPYFVLDATRAGSLLPGAFAAAGGRSGLLQALAHFDGVEILVSMTLYPYRWIVFALDFFARMNLGFLAAAPVGAWVLARGPERAWAPGLLLVALPILRGVMAPRPTAGSAIGIDLGLMVPVFLVCAAAGLLALWRSGGTALAARAARVSAVAILVVAVVALVRLESRLPVAEDAGLGAAARAVLPGARPAPALHPAVESERVALLAAGFAALVVLVAGFVRGTAARALCLGVGVIAAAAQVGWIARFPGTFARHVQNVQDMHVALGRWVEDNVPEGQRVAASDIGALAYFGGRPVVDVRGRATPSLAPVQSRSHLRSLNAMRSLRPGYFVFFPTEFPEWTVRPSLLAPLLSHRIDDNTILAAPTAGVYRADWESFAALYGEALIDRLDPAEAGGGLRPHWRRGMHSVGVPTRAELFATAGDARRGRDDLDGAEAAYRRAVALGAEHVPNAWVGLCAVLDRRHTPQAAGEIVRILDEFIRLAPNSAVPWELAGDFSRREGRTEKAYAQWSLALELHPDSVPLLQKLERLVRDFESEPEAEQYRARLSKLGAQPLGR